MCIIQPTTTCSWKFTICTYTIIILCTVHNMHVYYDHTVYSFHLYTVLWPEDGPQWPKHVVSTINRIQDSCVLTYPTPSLNNHFLPQHKLKILLTPHKSSVAARCTGTYSDICLPNSRPPISNQIRPSAGTTLMSEPHHVVTIRYLLLWLKRPQC